MKQLALMVSGMSCTGCEQRIETALGRLDGVVRAKANHQSGLVTAVINQTATSEQAVRESITKAGYEVTDEHRPG